MTASKVQDKNGQDIKDGDYIYTKIRGGSHRGNVDTIVTHEAGAEQEAVKNPLKVIFKDQHGHRVAHNPGTLERTQPEE
ncbi:hypothetical protein BJY04DRAFT_219560 [Aspergillus karnatakaensis]|uniref:DUF2945 domain-containing protein n=1 Tax=Aspergillus karnatakaensis TaxID=1810916 RepID=UPI003CCCF25C